MISTDVYATLETYLEEYDSRMEKCYTKFLKEEQDKLMKDEITPVQYEESRRAADTWLFGDVY